MQNQNRNQALDIAKGMLIILVVWGHCLQYCFGPDYVDSGDFFDDWLFRAVYSFHMPLFMLISGYLFYFSNRKPLRSVVISKLKAIGIPFVVYCTLMYLVSVAAHPASLRTVIGDYASSFSNYMWFLKSVLANCLIVSCVTHLFHGKKEKYGNVCFLLLFLISFLIKDRAVMAVHKFMYPYFMAGYFINRYGGNLTDFVSRRGMFLGMTLLFLVAVHFFTYDIFIYTTGFCIRRNHAYDLPQLGIDMLRFLIGFIASMWFMSLAVRMKVFSGRMVDGLVRIGRDTLAIYGLQSVILEVMNHILDKYDLNISYNYWLPVVDACGILLLAELILRLLRRNGVTRMLFVGGK